MASVDLFASFHKPLTNIPSAKQFNETYQTDSIDTKEISFGHTSIYIYIYNINALFIQLKKQRNTFVHVFHCFFYKQSHTQT